jgi:hypothetical protein
VANNSLEETQVALKYCFSQTHLLLLLLLRRKTNAALIHSICLRCRGRFSLLIGKITKSISAAAAAASQQLTQLILEVARAI